MNEADKIKQSLTMREVAAHYGFYPNRSGYISCPFHNEKTASLKIYDGQGGWHCFGCHVGGTVIDFVMRLFNLTYRQALMRIDADFHLGLFSYRDTPRMKSEAMERRRAEEAERLRQEEFFRQTVRDMWYYRDIIQYAQPVMDGDNLFFHPFYVEAVKNLPYLEYLLDDFLERSEEAGRKQST